MASLYRQLAVPGGARRKPSVYRQLSVPSAVRWWKLYAPLWSKGQPAAVNYMLPSTICGLYSPNGGRGTSQTSLIGGIPQLINVLFKMNYYLYNYLNRFVQGMFILSKLLHNKMLVLKLNIWDLLYIL